MIDRTSHTQGEVQGGSGGKMQGSQSKAGVEPPALSDEEKARYLHRGAQECPACGSRVLETDLPTWKGTEAVLYVMCHGCERSWYDRIRLVGVLTFEERMDWQGPDRSIASTGETLGDGQADERDREKEA